MKNKQTDLVFTLLQAAAAAIAALGTLCALWLADIGLMAIPANGIFGTEDASLTLYAILGLLTVGVVSLCSYGALALFAFMCQRLKKTTAFTSENAKALAGIAILCWISGGTVAVAGGASLLWGGFALIFLEVMAVAAAAYLCVGLASWALRLLLQRGILLEQENQLTI